MGPARVTLMSPLALIPVRSRGGRRQRFGLGWGMVDLRPTVV